MTSQSTTSPFGRTRTQELKWEALLDVASTLFNEKGQTGTSLQEVAARLKVSKRTVYNYVRNKEELVYHCYARTVGSSLEILNTALRSDAAGLDKIRAYVRAQLNDSLAPIAVVTEIASLSPKRALEIRADARQCRVSLKKIIRTGVADGTIVACNEALTAMAIFSIISWVPMWFTRSGSLSLQAVARIFEDVLVNGLRPDNIAGAPVDKLNEMPRHSTADHGRDISEIKKEALLRTATNLFNRKGIAGTSIDDVVGSLQVTKGVAYHYFDNKEQLLAGCYLRSLETGRRLLTQIEALSDDPMTRLYYYLQYFSETHAGPTGPMMIFAGLENLSKGSRREIHVRGRKLERKIEEWIHHGVCDGTLREINPKIARYVFIGAMDSLPKWYGADGAHTPGEIADCFFQIFSEGLRPRAAAALP